MSKVLIVGDSRKMKGGVSTVIKIIESSFLWRKYETYWLELQINSFRWIKILYLLRGILLGIFIIPRYDIIHFQTTPGAGMSIQFPLFLYACMWKKKKIVHLHVGDQLKKHQNDKLLHFCCNHSDLVFTLSKQWIEYIPINNKSKVHHLYNPAPDVSSHLEYKKYFLFAAYIDKNYNKGYDTLIEGWSKIALQFPDWKLVICGTGEMKQLNDQISKYHVNNSVVTTGWVEGPEKQKYFEECFAYVMTSLQEGLPMTIIEAIAYGKPIISTRVGCLPEFLEDQKSALFFDFKDSNGLAKMMKLLIEKPNLRDTLIQHEKVILDSNFAQEIFLNRLDSYYQSLA